MHKKFTVGSSVATIFQKDAVDFLKSLKPNTVDLILTSPPYFIGKEYDLSKNIADFKEELSRVSEHMVRALRPGGSLCWQVGSHVSKGRFTPLDSIVFAEHLRFEELVLRNRIVWTFDHGLHLRQRFSGRHETILWYTKGDEYYFDLDSVRVRQKYPGKRHYKGPNKGEWSGNPLGKNPGDVWVIPNVKARHVEKTGHPCQFPVALARRLVLALAPQEGVVVDPYMGSGTSAVAALSANRNFRGCDIAEEYFEIAVSRLTELKRGELLVREDKPPRDPKPTEAVAILPSHFSAATGDA
ncbi:MAG: DNA-methyltransferase [Rhodanobacter sp.]